MFKHLLGIMLGLLLCTGAMAQTTHTDTKNIIIAANSPPGLQKKGMSTPPSFLGKTPPGWNEGLKKGWNKNKDWRWDKVNHNWENKDWRWDNKTKGWQRHQNWH